MRAVFRETFSSVTALKRSIKKLLSYSFISSGPCLCWPGVFPQRAFSNLSRSLISLPYKLLSLQHQVWFSKWQWSLCIDVYVCLHTDCYGERNHNFNVGGIRWHLKALPDHVLRNDRMTDMTRVDDVSWIPALTMLTVFIMGHLQWHLKSDGLNVTLYIMQDGKFPFQGCDWRSDAKSACLFKHQKICMRCLLSFTMYFYKRYMLCFKTLWALCTAFNGRILTEMKWFEMLFIDNNTHKSHKSLIGLFCLAGFKGVSLTFQQVRRGNKLATQLNIS